MNTIANQICRHFFVISFKKTINYLKVLDGRSHVLLRADLHTEVVLNGVINEGGERFDRPTRIEHCGFREALRFHVTVEKELPCCKISIKKSKLNIILFINR